MSQGNGEQGALLNCAWTNSQFLNDPTYARTTVAEEVAQGDTSINSKRSKITFSHCDFPSREISRAISALGRFA
jgi:hypothetical protein